MQKLNLLIGILIGLTILSCSSDNDESNIQNTNGTLIKWSKKDYDTTNGELLFFTEYLISENKISNIITYDGDDNFGSKLQETIINYENGRIVKTETMSFGNLNLDDNEANYFYDNNGNIIEIISIQLGTDFYRKITYDYNNDFIKLTRWLSNDGGTTYHTQSSNSEIKLYFNDNDDLVSAEPPSIEYVYDNGNTAYIFSPPNTEVNYSYTDKVNPLSEIFLNTYGGKIGFYLISRPNFLTDIVENINRNIINSITGNDIPDYIVNHTFNSDILTQTEVLGYGIVDSRIVYEFEYR